MGSGEYVLKESAKSSDENGVTEASDNELKDLSGRFEIKTSLDGESLGEIRMIKNGDDSLSWQEYTSEIKLPDGVCAFYLIYHGESKAQLKEIKFN